MSKKNRQAVWDIPVRVLHWLLVASIATAWITGGRIGATHEYAGYAAFVIVLSRLSWGWLGNRHARFAGFVRPFGETRRYLRDVVGGRASRYVGHNPLGGWMVIALLACVALLGVTGWLATTDALWGYAWPVNLHAAIAWGLLVLVTLHVAGVLFTSWQHRENLVAAMITGEKETRVGDERA